MTAAPKAGVAPHIDFAETTSTTVGCHHPVSTSVVPMGSASCPICGVDTPHAHDAGDVGRWASNLVARWGYRAVVVAASAPDPHETNRELRAENARQDQAYDASWAHVQARLRELEREVSEWHEASEVLGGVTPSALRERLVGLMARAERSNELPGLTATLDELRHDLAEAERHHVEHHERENAASAHGLDGELECIIEETPHGFRIAIDVQNVEAVQQLLNIKDAEIVRLRERVRFHAVNVEPDRDWVGCGECASAWPWGEPEAHASGCVAAP